MAPTDGSSRMSRTRYRIRTRPSTRARPRSSYSYSPSRVTSQTITGEDLHVTCVATSTAKHRPTKGPQASPSRLLQ